MCLQGKAGFGAQAQGCASHEGSLHLQRGWRDTAGSHQGHCHGAAPCLQERAQKGPGPLPSWKNTSWLGADNKENSGYSTHSLPLQYLLPAQNHSCFRVQSMVLASPGRPGPAWEDLHKSPYLVALGDNAWDCGSGSSRMPSARCLPSSGLSPASQACADVSHCQKV